MAARTVMLFGAVSTAVACASTTVTEEQETVTASATITSEQPEVGAPLLDARALRFKDALAEAGLTAGVPDETLLAVARGLCDQIADGVPEDRMVETILPIAAYAASVSESTVLGDEAARHYIVVARDEFC